MSEQVLKPRYLIESGTDDYEDPAEEMEMEVAEELSSESTAEPQRIYSGATAAAAEPQRIYSGATAEVEMAEEMEMEVAEEHSSGATAGDMTTSFARREHMIRFILEHYTFVSGAWTTTREIKDAFFRFANHVPPFTEAQMNNYIGHAINVATTTTGQTLKDQGVQTKAKWDGAKIQQGYLNLGPLHGCAPP